MKNETKNKEQVHFVCKLVKYGNVIFHNGTKKQREEVLKFLSTLAKELESKPSKVINFKNKVS
jgi:hypothetical protein